MLKYKENPDIDFPLVISLLETRGGIQGYGLMDCIQALFYVQASKTYGKSIPGIICIIIMKAVMRKNQGGSKNKVVIRFSQTSARPKKLK